MALQSVDVASSGIPTLTYKATKTGGIGGVGLVAGTICRIVWDDNAALGRRNTAELAVALEIATRRVLQLETD